MSSFTNNESNDNNALRVNEAGDNHAEYYDSEETLEARGLDQTEMEKQREQWRDELSTLENEIRTLRSVLGAKLRDAAALKRKLGITPVTEIKQDVKQGLQTIKESGAYQKTNSAFRSFGAYAYKKVGDIKNSPSFKSFQGKLGDTYTTVKSRMSGSRTTDGFTEIPANPTEQEFTEAGSPKEGSTAKGSKPDQPGSTTKPDQAKVAPSEKLEV